MGLLTDELNRASGGIRDRLNQWNARTGDDPDRQAWIRQDQNRLNQLGMLSNLLSSPTITQNADREADTYQRAQDLGNREGYRQAEGDRSVRGASTGQAGGSVDAQRAAANAQRLAKAQATAQQQAAEIRAAGIAGAEGFGRQLLSQILAEDQDAQGAMGTGLDLARSDITGQSMQRQLDEQSRTILADAIGGFTRNTASPWLDAGFLRAQRLNDRDAMRGIDSNRSWNLWGN